MASASELTCCTSGQTLNDMRTDSHWAPRTRNYPPLNVESHLIGPPTYLTKKVMILHAGDGQTERGYGYYGMNDILNGVLLALQ